MDIKKDAYFLSHNGLGDNITNIGAVNFLLQYYNTVYFLCKDIYKNNVELLFVNKSVVVVPFDSKNEFQNCNEILSNVKTETHDIFVSGFHINYFKSFITNKELINYKKNNKYDICFSHINNFYNDIGLDSSIYIDYFDIDSCDLSTKYYEEISKYKIIFLHTKGSNRDIQLFDIIQKYINEDDYIIICADKNVYDLNHSKYFISEKYVNIKIAYYIDIIKHAEIIHLIDSCFSCIVYPLLKSKKIQPKECLLYSSADLNISNVNKEKFDNFYKMDLYQL